MNRIGKVFLALILVVCSTSCKHIIYNVEVALPYHAKADQDRLLWNCNNEEKFNQIVFVDQQDTVLGGDQFCPIVRTYITKNHIELRYRVKGEHVAVQYSPFYEKTGEDSYSMITQTIVGGEQNTLPIESVSGIIDGAVLEVMLDVSLSGLRKVLVFTSCFYVVPRSEDMSYEQWKQLCDESVNTDADNVVYCSSNVDREYVTCALPDMKRRINLRQDLYQTCSYAPVNVTDVNVSGLAEGGILAQVCFDPVESPVETNFIFQYYNEESLMSDSRHVFITPGQTSVDIVVSDGYDQFALVGFSDKLSAFGVRSPNIYMYDSNSRERLFPSGVFIAGANALIPSSRRIFDWLNISIEINDRADYGLHCMGHSGYLYVDHRTGFWQHLIYNNINSIAYVRIIMLLLGLVYLVYLIVSFFRD